VAALVALAVCSQAAAASTPRGVLTQAEYQEFLDTEKAEAQLGHGAITQVARRDCRGLTNVSRLTRTEHAECEASFVFFYRLVEFTTQFTACAKDSAKSVERRCLERATKTFSWSANRFLTTDSASQRAALQRGFGGKCLGYLILTPAQRSAMNKLVSGLRNVNRALVTGNSVALIRATERFSADMSVARKALLVSGTVKVCRHE
jgi:hypothetical protein